MPFLICLPDAELQTLKFSTLNSKTLNTKAQTPSPTRQTPCGALATEPEALLGGPARRRGLREAPLAAQRLAADTSAATREVGRRSLPSGPKAFWPLHVYKVGGPQKGCCDSLQSI